MLTAAQVAAQLGISPRKVYDIDAGLLPRHEFGRAVRYEQADVTEYKAKCRSIVTKKLVAGALNLTVASRVRAESECVSDFRKHGVEPRRTPLIGRSQRASTPLPPESKSLLLVSSKL